MSRRTKRSQLIHRLVSPVRTRLSHRVPRVHRSFRPSQPRWSFGQRPLGWQRVDPPQRTRGMK